MWFYTCYFLHIYLLIFDGIQFATTTLALGSPSAPKTSRSVNTKDIWKELQEVTEGSIPLETKDKAPKTFVPTHFIPEPQDMEFSLNTLANYIKVFTNTT